jgi:hypothetical protein
MRRPGVESLAKILEPYAPEEFINSVWGVNFLHVRGDAGKFAHLMPWERLNEVLQRHRLDFPRLRLVSDGKTLAVSSFLRHLSSPRRRTTVPRLIPVELTKQLRAGATLVLDAVDELQKPIEALAVELEWLFREHVQVNLYAGWQTSRGFDLHWDDHDVFILQVTGRKRWSLYGMTRPYPLVSDIERAEKPDHAPLWEETLEAGHLLYIPRGWWHVAVPLAEPTLHLTVGVHNQTGVDLLRWVADRMRASETFRRDLAQFASAAERTAHLERMRAELLKEWDDNLQDRFFQDRDSLAEPRTNVNFPNSAMPKAALPSMHAVVRLLAPRPLKLETTADTVEFSALKNRWRFAASAFLVLQPLAERRVCSVAELCQAAKGRLDERTVRAFLGELTEHGLIAVAEG